MDRAQIITSYNDLILKGYFSDKIGGNELYVGPLMIAQIPKSAKSILEIGGATGLWMRQLLQKRNSIRSVTVVEISDAIYEYRRRIEPILNKNPESRFEAIHSDFLEAEEKLQSSDIVVSSYVAEYMGNTSAYIQKLYDLTNPGGTTIFVDVLTDEKHYESGIDFKSFMASFAKIAFAYLQNGQMPPFFNILKAHSLSHLFKENAFQELNLNYHSKYNFPKHAWLSEQKKYPNAKFYDLGLAGMLVLSKD